MNLIIDIGNTRAKIAIFKDDKLKKVRAIKLETLFQTIKELLKKNTFENSIIASVANKSSKTLQLLKKKTNCIHLNSLTEIPFKNLYKTPKTLGVDRIALLASAVKHYPNKNVLVIDAGTCITYDFINTENEYFGGAIAPGLQMKYDALNHFTKKLPLLKPKAFIKLGNSTKNAIHQGIINGTVLEIDGIINQYKAKNNNLTIVLTGGDTFFLAKLLKSSIFANPNFLLEGLNHIINYNSKK